MIEFHALGLSSSRYKRIGNFEFRNFCKLFVKMSGRKKKSSALGVVARHADALRSTQYSSSMGPSLQCPRQMPDWPYFPPLERIKAGITEIALGLLVFAGFGASTPGWSFWSPQRDENQAIDFANLPERVFTHTSLGGAFAGGLFVSLALDAGGLSLTYFL
jgi:hypothetical protein